MPASYTAGNVMDLAAALLNDATQKLFNYTAQLPFLKLSMRDLDQDLTLIGNPLNMISEDEIPVAIGALALTLPDDFFLPLALQEKGSSDTYYVNMSEKTDISLLDATQSSTLVYWDFRHNDINFIGSTEARTVKLVYWRQLTELVDENSLSEVSGAQNLLAFRTASLCARHIGGNKAKADDLMVEYIAAMDRIESLTVKNNQGLRKRRRPFRTNRYSTQTVRIP